MTQPVQVTVVSAPFGRAYMVAQIGQTVLKHALIFTKATRARAEAQAARIQAMLEHSANPLAELDSQHWIAPEDLDARQRLFKARA